MSAFHCNFVPLSLHRTVAMPGAIDWSRPSCYYDGVSDTLDRRTDVSGARIGRNENRQVRRLIPWLIYVVDECPGLANLARAILEAEGFPVRAFSDRTEAWRAFVYAVPRPRLLIIGDLAGFSGIELIRRCRAMEPGLKTLWVSHRDPSSLTRRDRALVDGFQPRPYCSSILVHAVWRLCGPPRSAT